MDRAFYTMTGENGIINEARIYSVNMILSFGFETFQRMVSTLRNPNHCQQFIRKSYAHNNNSIPDEGWKPSVINRHDTESDLVKERKKALCLLLNKISNTKFEEILQEIKGIHIENVEELNSFVNLIFDKALEEHHYGPLYAKLCYRLRSFYSHLGGENESTFVRLLLKRCQKEFECIH